MLKESNTSSSLLPVADDDRDVVKYDPVTGEQLYTPARSSWGVFQRPKDISKTYGGGRVLTRAEMDKWQSEVS